LPEVQHWLAWAQTEPADLTALEAAVSANAFLTGGSCTAADIVAAAWVAGSGAKAGPATQKWVVSVVGDAPVKKSTVKPRADKAGMATAKGGGSKSPSASAGAAGQSQSQGKAKGKTKGKGTANASQAKTPAKAKSPTPPIPKKSWDRGFGAVGPQYYVTTAINYTNGLPHCGHAYEGVTADVVARYHRNYGRDTFFMTGSDEHGKKIALTAEKESLAGDPSCDSCLLDIVHRFWREVEGTGGEKGG
jgi:hypothetical protein